MEKKISAFEAAKAALEGADTVLRAELGASETDVPSDLLVAQVREKALKQSLSHLQAKQAEEKSLLQALKGRREALLLLNKQDEAASLQPHIKGLEKSTSDRASAIAEASARMAEVKSQLSRYSGQLGAALQTHLTAVSGGK